MSYKLVCGIETHVELATKTKIFCSCTTAFGGKPNTQCCPICTGQPGALPVLNKKAVEYAVRAGLAVGCKINNYSHTDRKNYFYPDLPKAYQISQFDEPLCENGFVELSSGKRIGIERIHIEEDAGKLFHDAENTYVDYNRSGVPLIEIVSAPEIETPEEAREYAEKLRLIMLNIGVSDCKMQEGSMRCDVNVSLHREGEPFGTRTEIKNLGSLSNIVRAVELEMKRQEEILSSGGKVVQSTMRYDEKGDRVHVLRIKENADDYRYFPEPDVPRFYVSDEEIERIRAELPELPDKRLERYIAMGLNPKKAALIYKYRNVTAFFEEAISLGAKAETALNLIISTVFAALKTEDDRESFELRITTGQFVKLAALIDEKKINAAKGKAVLSKMLECGKSADELLSEDELRELSDEDLEAVCKTAVISNPKAVNDYRYGKEKAMNALLGFVMKATRGKADTEKAKEIIQSVIRNS